MNAADTLFVIISAALVLLMTPGLAIFYAGMVRSKNVLGTIMQSFILIIVISIEWVLVGYSLSFGPDQFGLIGSLAWFGLRGVTAAPSAVYATTMPQLVFMIFQCMFAVITPALITGAVAERMKFRAFLIFSLLWAILVYNPLCHWIWAQGGWLARLGALDFAGGVAVHVSSGAAALVAAIMLGRRKGYGTQELRPHSLPLTLLGAGILWFGWFGFNAGSALSVGNVAASTFVATHLAACTGGAVWLLMERFHAGKATTLGAASGVIAGLATITPASGYVGPVSALIIGALAGAFCYLGIMAKNRFGYDDSLDVVGIHGVGGVLGLLAAGLFASTAINPGAASGLFFGNPAQLGVQAVAVAATIAYSVVMTVLLLKVTSLFGGLRLTPGEEIEGLDLSQHDETGYVL